MFRRFLSIALAGLLVSTCAVRLAHAASRDDKQPRFTAKVKEGIVKLGTGPEARVKVKLRDNTKLTGYISETSDEHFILMNLNGGKPTRVAFSDVAQLKGNNLSNGARIGITLAAVGVIAILMLIAAPRS